ncbi:MAG: hypothetical protein FD123_541 [Bacteroidetes bacterium]|nr:MAG: hypothetical protein FD123_541 [Bacteroidota bacterium]
MENKQASSEPKEKKTRLHALYLTVIFLLTCLCGVLAWQYWEQKKRGDQQVVHINQVVVEKENVQAQLLDLQEDFAQLQTNDAALAKELDEKRAYIAELLEQAEKNKNNAVIIAQLRRETETLRKIMKGYIRQIDSLATVNNTLRDEKKKVEGDLSVEKDKSKSLQSDKEALQGRIDRAALLTTLNVKATGVRFSRGGKKEDETNKAKRAEKIKVTFDVAENKLTKSGPKEIFIRIITPDGKEMTRSADNDHMFEFDGAKGFYAAKKNIDYNNQPMTVLVYCAKAKEEDELLPGKYIIEITADKATIGKTTLTLE